MTVGRQLFTRRMKSQHEMRERKTEVRERGLVGGVGVGGSSQIERKMSK